MFACSRANDRPGTQNHISMKSNTRILKFVAAAALVAGTVSVSSAAGLLGQRYVGATFDWVLWDNDELPGGDLDDGRGLSLTFNQPLSSNVDLSLDYSYLDAGGTLDLGEGDIYNFDASSQAVTFNATFYMPAGNVKPFVKAGAGWAWAKIDGDSDNDTIYQIVPGVEIPAGEKATLTLFAAWQDYFDNESEDDGFFTFGATAEFALNDKVSLLATGSVDDDSNYGISAGAILRF